MTSTTCTRCALPFDTVHAAAQHAWKSQDDDHDDLDTLDSAIEEMAADGKSPSETMADDGTDTVNDTVDEPPSPTVGDGASTAPSDAVTDGGASGLGLDGPPETSSGADGDDGSPATLDCPSCGTDTGATEDDLDADTVYTCTDCGADFRWLP